MRPRPAIAPRRRTPHGLAAGPGDIDEDGRDVFAPGGAAGHEGDVIAFIFCGRADGFDPSIPVSAADVILRGDPVRPYDAWMPIAAAGDHDRDGHGDIIIGTSSLADDRGGFYFISGQGMRWTGDSPAQDIATTCVGSEQPIWFTPEVPPSDFSRLPRDHAGVSVDGNGDVDGDGHADLIISASAVGNLNDALGRACVLRAPAPGLSR